MTFRIATKTEIDPYFPTLWLDYITLCIEVNQARGSLLPSLSLLAVGANIFVQPFSRCPIYMGAKHQKVFTRRIRIIFHGASGRNLDTTAYCR
jgi:hypothetical protein